MHCHSVACTVLILGLPEPRLDTVQVHVFFMDFACEVDGIIKPIQLIAFLSLDGCLLERQFLSALQDSRDKYGITRIRKKAVRHLEEPVSFVSLSRWKEEGDGIALVEACPDTLPLVDCLLRFWMVDEMVIYLIPRLQGGIRLFGDALAPSVWKLTGNIHFDTGVCRLDYLHTGY